MSVTQIKSDGIANDAVTLAKQAAGTDGQIITYDASGNPTAVGPGSDGQVLTSTGAGSPPAFEAIPTLNQNTTGTAAIATTVTVADESSDTTCFPLFVTAATGDLAPKTGTNLAFNSSTGVLQDAKGDVRNIPNSSKTTAYELVATDGGKAIHITTGGVTVPNAVFAGGEAVTIVNASGSNQTITQATSLTMYNAADAATGNRTLAGRGVATIWFHNGSTAYITGAGLS